MLKIKPTAKLPLKQFVNKGSYKERLEYAKILNDTFYEKLMQEQSHETVSVDSFKKILNETIPENIDLDVKTTGGMFANPYFAVIKNKEDEIYKLELMVPSRKNLSGKEYLCSKDNYMTMHETFHLFAGISNPKHNARPFFDEDEQKFYRGRIYNLFESKKFGIKEKLRFKKRLQEFLSKQDSEKQINFLQRCRYNLTEEILAFKESEKYGGKSKNLAKWLFFEEKLKIIKKVLYKILMRARKNTKTLVGS